MPFLSDQSMMLSTRHQITRSILPFLQVSDPCIYASDIKMQAWGIPPHQMFCFFGSFVSGLLYNRQSANQTKPNNRRHIPYYVKTFSLRSTNRGKHRIEYNTSHSIESPTSGLSIREPTTSYLPPSQARGLCSFPDFHSPPVIRTRLTCFFPSDHPPLSSRRSLLHIFDLSYPISELYCIEDLLSLSPLRRSTSFWKSVGSVFQLLVVCCLFLPPLLLTRASVVRRGPCRFEGVIDDEYVSWVLSFTILFISIQQQHSQ